MARLNRVSGLLFFAGTATAAAFPLSLHDALPICGGRRQIDSQDFRGGEITAAEVLRIDRKSTRLNSSHVAISYAGFSLKKKRQHRQWLCVYRWAARSPGPASVPRPPNPIVSCERW